MTNIGEFATWVAAAMLCLLAAPAGGLTIGNKTCANAEVIADVGDQTWQRIAVYDSDAVFMDGILHVELQVKRGI